MHSGLGPKVHSHLKCPTCKTPLIELLGLGISAAGKQWAPFLCHTCVNYQYAIFKPLDNRPYRVGELIEVPRS